MWVGNANGELKRISPDRLPEFEALGWSPGLNMEKLAKTKGKHLGFKDGKQAFFDGPLPEGWTRQSGRVWINNGSSTKQIKHGEALPEGWTLGRLAMAQESREQISRALKGRSGTPHTESSKAKLRVANRGRVMSEDDKAKMSKKARERSGSRYVYNPETLERRRVKGEVLQGLLRLGWKIGKGPSI
jgi:hypothetical protein